MFGSTILDVAIGLALVYALLSLLGTAIGEALESILKQRAKYLERGIANLLRDSGRGDTKLTDAIYNHPLVYALYDGKLDRGRPRFWKNLPSYIPARNFALALMDIVVRGAEVEDGNRATPATPFVSVTNLRGTVASIANPPVQRALLTALDAAGNELSAVQQHLEQWFDSSMERVAGWYKRHAQKILLGIGVVLAVGGNVNTLRIASFLYRDTPAREALVARASAAVQDSTTRRLDAREVSAALDSLNLPIGWTTSAREAIRTAPGRHQDWRLDLWFAILGWLATAVAVSLGAPFWFDLLNKFVSLRSTAKPAAREPARSSGPSGPTTGGPATAGALAAAGAPGGLVASAPFEPHTWAQGEDPNEGVL